MYPSDWHDTYGDVTLRSAETILPAVIETFGVKSSIEIGCGHAHWTSAMVSAGISDVLAVDGPWADRESLLVAPEAFREVDLREPLKVGRTFDLAICLEVAEHVQESSADVLAHSLANVADVILLGAAIPMQGGHGHVNEQWPSYWRSKMEANGFELFDLVRPRHWNDKNLHYWYRQNIFVYVRTSNVAAMSRAKDDQAAQYRSPVMIDAVHPEKFNEVASYDAIAMKRLLRALPSWVKRRIQAKRATRA